MTLTNVYNDDLPADLVRASLNLICYQSLFQEFFEFYIFIANRLYFTV